MRPALALLVVLCAAPLQAQGHRPRLEIVLSQSAGQVDPAVVTTNLLADPHTRDLLVNGAFPAGIHFRLELWRKGGWFDDLDGHTEWTMLVSYDPTKQVFRIVRRQDNQLLEDFGAFNSIDAADAQIAQPFRVPLRPRRAGRYYYSLIVEVETLTESDLDALQQFLRGTRTQGTSRPLSWLGKSFGKLLSRLLGGDKRHYDQRSGVFSVP